LLTRLFLSLVFYPSDSVRHIDGLQ